MPTLRARVRPRWPLRLPGPGLDGLARRVPGPHPAIERLLHVDDAPVRVTAAQPARDAIVLTATADRPDVAEEGLARMRFAVGVDDDLRDFHERFRHDPLIGPSVRADPGLGRSGRELGQELVGCHPHRTAQALLVMDAPAEPGRDLRRRTLRPTSPGHVEERLVERQRLDQRGDGAEHLHQTGGDLRVVRVVSGQQHQIRQSYHHSLQRLRSAGCGNHLVPLTCQKPAYDLHVLQLIIDDKHDTSCNA